MELITIRNDLPVLSDETTEQLASILEAKKLLERAEKEIKEKLLAEMQEKNIYKVESDELSITYIAPFDRETFDSKRLQKDNPELYDEYITFTTVKPSVRVKLK